MKIKGYLINMLKEIDQENYVKFIEIENEQNFLYIKMVKTLYGMLTFAVQVQKRSRKCWFNNEILQ